MPENSGGKHPSSQPFVYRGTHDKILKEAIYPLYLLTAKQVTRLLYPSEKLGMFKTIEDRLNKLTREKYLSSYPLPTAKGQRPHMYHLGLEGFRLLEREGFDLSVHQVVSDMKERSYDWQHHLLELNNVFITAMIIDKYIAGLTLFDFAHDYVIKKHPVIACNLLGKKVAVEPDGFLHLRQDSGKSAYFLLELDRNSHSNDSFRKKISDTICCFRQGNLTSHFNARRLTLLYLTTCGQKRVEQMRYLTRLELTRLKLSSQSYEARMFKFGSIPALGEPQIDPKGFFCSPMWLTAYGEKEEAEALIPLEDVLQLQS